MAKIQLGLTKRVVFNVNGETLSAIDRAAERKMMSTSAWLRGLVSDRLAEEGTPRERQREAAVADAAA